MPISVFELNVDATDAQLRIQFVDYTRDLLDYIVQNNVEDGLNAAPVRPEVEALMQAAWEEALPLFQELQQNIQQINNEAVRVHGLSGAQLRFKLANVEWWSQQVNAAAAEYQLTNWIAIIKRLLDSIDTLLDSILAASGTGSALKEMKESIMNATIQ